MGLFKKKCENFVFNSFDLNRDNKLIMNLIDESTTRIYC